jgi:hypothetical protein
MSGVSSFDYQMMQARVAANHKSTRISEQKRGGCDDESQLHSAILSHCKCSGWIAFHGAMNKPTARQLGEPDFIILADNGKTWFIEAKTRLGKMRPEQQGILRWAANLGHTIHVVRSLKEFLEICVK